MFIQWAPAHYTFFAPGTDLALTNWQAVQSVCAHRATPDEVVNALCEELSELDRKIWDTPARSRGRQKGYFKEVPPCKIRYARTKFYLRLDGEHAPPGGNMRYLHTMVRVGDLEKSLDFYCAKLGLDEVRRMDSPAGRFTLVFLAAPGDRARAVAERAPLLELTYNWDKEDYGSARNFGHLAFEVDDIYAFCQRLREAGITINRPPRDGRMAFIRSPDNISIEILQKGPALPQREPWGSMPNTGTW